MIPLAYDEIIEKIHTEKGIPVEEIQQKIKAKMEQLSGLISKDGAAYIVANELGIKLIKANGLLKIKDILAGMRSVETAGKVIRKFPVTEFTKDDRKGKVGSFIIADETGQIRVTCWHDMCDLLSQFGENDTIKIVGGYVRDNRGQQEIHMNERSKIVLHPEGVTIGAVYGAASAARADAPRKKISELTDQDQNVEVFGTIVQVFDPRFYEICPQCGKKCLPRDNAYICDEHGEVKHTYGYVINAVLDDGSENIRAVFFRGQMQRLLKLSDEQIQQLRLSPNFETLKTELLGEQVRVVGRVSNNQMFQRLELVAGQVFRDIDPNDEMKRISA